jgi:hypothetical protein
MAPVGLSASNAVASSAVNADLLKNWITLFAMEVSEFISENAMGLPTRPR